MGSAIGEIDTAIEKLRQKVAWLENEIPRTRAKLETLVEARKILQGDADEADFTSPRSSVETPAPNLKMVKRRAPRSRPLQPGSATSVAVSILRELGSPLKAAEVYEFASGNNDGLSKRNFVSNMYRLARKNRVFKIESGTVGLLEWEDKKDDSDGMASMEA